MTKTRRLAIWTAVATWVQVAIGGTVRTTESGAGCGATWPLCKEGILPALSDTSSLIEFSHRAMATIVSVLIAALLVSAWRAHRNNPWLLRPAIIAVVLIVVQVALGAVTVDTNLNSWLVLLHLYVAMVTFAVILVAAAGGPRATLAPAANLVGRDKAFTMSVAAIFSVLVIFFTGGLVVGTDGADAACPTWPACGSQAVFPALNSAAGIQDLHRLLVLLVSLHIFMTLRVAWRARPRNFAVRQTVSLGLAALLSQVFIGADLAMSSAASVAAHPNVSGYDPGSDPNNVLLGDAHVAMAALVFGMMVLLALMVYRSGNRGAPAGAGVGAVVGPTGRPSAGRADEPSTVAMWVATWTERLLLLRPVPVLQPVMATSHVDVAPVRPIAGGAGPSLLSADAWQLAPAGWRQLARDLVAMMKLRLASLLLFVSLVAMLIAGNGHPSPQIVLVTLVCGLLSSSACFVFNQLLESDKDAVMERTHDRPIASGRVTPGTALVFGLILTVVSCTGMLVFANALSAGLMLFAILYYVFVYTLWLKPSTPQGVVVGGVAGALPPLIGWAAVTGNITLLPLYLFAIIFFWTPPHFWALSLVLEEDYRRGQYPMLPIVVGREETRRQILAHSAVLITVTLLPVGFGLLGLTYLLAALLLGGGWALFALRLYRRRTVLAASLLFRYSLAYLALLFLSMVVDRLMVGPGPGGLW